MKCPLCGSVRAKNVSTIDVDSVIDLWRRQYEIDITSEFQNVSQMELWCCRDCGISFFLPASLVGSPAIYAQLEKIEWYYPPWKWEYEQALRDLRGHRSILEIGSGSGNFIKLAGQQAGLCVEGIEQNKKAIDEAIMRGLHVRESTVEMVASESPSSYDAVCSFQVLEHVADPAAFLDACCTLLRQGGLLVLAVPNQNSYVRHMINPLDMPPHHMTRWTRAPFLFLPEHFPLELVRTAYEPLTDGQTELYVETYASMARRRGLSVFVRPWVCTQAVRLIHRLGIGRFLRGQNIYACFIRI